MLDEQLPSEANEHLEAILESIKDGFFSVNRNWLVVYWNKQAEKLLKKRREEMLGKHLWDVYPSSEHMSSRSQEIIFHKEYNKVMKHRMASSFVGYYSPLEAWFDVSVYPARNGGISVFFKDITGQRKAEKERRHLQQVLEKSVNEVYISDSATLLFTFVNEAAISNTGYSRRELLTMTPTDLIVEKDLASVHEKAERLRRKEKNKFVFETYHQRVDGSHYHVEVHLQLIEDESAFLAIILDTSERKKAEEEREKLIRELSRNNQDLRQFSYIISHNLRSPITNLTSLANLLDDASIGKKEQREVLKDLQSSVRELNETIDDLTKILVIRDTAYVEQEQIPFSEAVREALQQVKSLIDRYHPRIICDFDDAPSVRFNKAYLQSIFLNLLTNSIKFRSPRRHPEIRIRSRDGGDHVLLEFQDNGLGLDIQRCKDRLFGLYQTFHGHTNSKGLGLFLVKYQVKALGGSIEAKSAPGKGMTIQIRFKK